MHNNNDSWEVPCRKYTFKKLGDLEIHLRPEPQVYFLVEEDLDNIDEETVKAWDKEIDKIKAYGGDPSMGTTLYRVV